MSGFAAEALAALNLLQATLIAFDNSVAFANYFCPVSADIDTVCESVLCYLIIINLHQSTAVVSETHDVVIIGAGTAGSVLAYRLAETNLSVLVLEAGGCPPMESLWPGYFTFLPYSVYDYAMNISDTGPSCQNLKHGLITAGKMLGGSSSLDHLMIVRPVVENYNSWEEAANDPGWGYPELVKYFKKGENMQDKSVRDYNPSTYGTSGPLILTKQKSPSMDSIINALGEMGSTYSSCTEGPSYVNFPLLNIGNTKKNTMRQSGLVSYISKIVNKKNIKFLTGATVTKILFSGTTATGVQFTAAGSDYTVNAKKIISSAGTFKSSQLLMLSGVGDSAVLDKLNIPVVIDNPQVGQQLQDHVTIVLSYALESPTEAAPTMSPSMWPTDMITNYAASGTTQDIIMKFPSNSAGLIQLLGNVLKYEDWICDAIHESNINRTNMVNLLNLSKPASRGSVVPTTTSIFDQPRIELNLLSEDSDLDVIAKAAKAFNEILNTKEFKNIGAKMAEVGVCSDLCKDTLEYWKCYVLELSSSLGHYVGTCALGTVVDSDLSVIGTTNLRVVDASVVPSIPSVNPSATVRAYAEKAADIIKKEFGITDSGDEISHCKPR